MIVEQKSKRIISVRVGRGREHDFRVCKRSKCAAHLNAATELLGDSGYQGVKELHEKSRTPYKRSKKKPLTKEERLFNKKLSRERVVVEHVIRRLKRPRPVRCRCRVKKIFRVLKEVYRHRRRRFGLRVHLLAGLYNADLAVKG